MKTRILGIVLVLCLLVTATVVPAMAYNPDPHIAGDANSDGIVNDIDFTILAAAYLSYPASRSVNEAANSRWDARADFNGDLIVNAVDFSILSVNYLQFNP